jgi:hypothetical protein
MPEYLATAVTLIPNHLIPSGFCDGSRLIDESQSTEEQATVVIIPAGTRSEIMVDFMGMLLDDEPALNKPATPTPRRRFWFTEEGIRALVPPDSPAGIWRLPATA